MNCNFCSSTSIDNVYTPIKSKVDLKINLCKNCGLVFGSFDNKLYKKSNTTPPNTKFSHLSCDADYSDVRVGKQQMVNYIFDALTTNPITTPINKILDMRSARGHFALKALEYFNLNSIDCIEEDDYMTVTYDNDPCINIFRDKYYNLNTNYNYDLIYSCHTLEHYSNPTKVLNFIKSRLSQDGLFYIDVPNINNIDHNFNIDEFFYDKHLFYYDCDVLSSYIESLGLELIFKQTTSQNIGLLFKNSTTKKSYPVTNRYEKNLKLINDYSSNINNNRNKLIEIGDDLNKQFTNTKNNVIIGCGRPLDTFIHYGNLDLNNFEYLVDDYLTSITDSLYNKSLNTSTILNKILPDAVLLLVKHPSPKLLDLITKNNSKVKIVYLSKLLNNA
jgi:hypothetical protein